MEGPQQPADAALPTPPNRPSGDAGTEPGLSGGATIRLGPRDALEGRLVFDGDVRVYGSLEGEATLSGDLQVESAGSVKAKVQARSLSVRGALEGEVTAKERLIVAGSGTVSGTILASPRV